MKQKILWLMVSSLMVLSLVLASCATAPTPTPSPTPTPAPSPYEPPKPIPQPTTKEVPKYGGVFTRMEFSDINRGFDPIKNGYFSPHYVGMTVFEGLGMGDWARGPGGTNEWSFIPPAPPMKYSKGYLAESWELSPNGLTLTFHLRKGIHFINRPPVNGREFVAADVKYCLDRMSGTGSGFTTPSSYNYGGFESIQAVDAPDKYTVVITCKKYDYALLPRLYLENFSEIYPHEAVEAPGGLDNFHNVVGTGAFYVSDYVPASSLTLTKNQEYWLEDELHPGNKLPYFDEFITFIIPDQSTQLAALRAGQVDLFNYLGFGWRIGDDLKKTNPKLQFGGYWSNSTTCIYIQNDVKPLDDVRVRQALQMAWDTLSANEIVGGPGGGKTGRYGSLLNESYGPDLYTPFDQLPQNIKDIRTYNPEKAKKLLADAGYPNGFKLEMVVDPTQAFSDEAPIVADYFGRIGVQVDIQVKDTTTWNTLSTSRGYNQSLLLAFGVVPGTGFFQFYGPNKRFRHNDTEGEALLYKAFGTQDDATRNKMFKELNFRVMENAMTIFLTARPPYITVAQPWVRGWHGELGLREHSYGGTLERLWLDLDMKKAMIGK